MKEGATEILASVALGIRYSTNFRIADNFGSIMDDLLYGDDSYFDKEFFPLVQTSQFEIVLVDEKIKTKKLTINNANIILELPFGESIKPSDLNQIRHAFEQQIIKGVMKKYKISGITRFGYLRRNILQSSSLSKNFTALASRMEGARDLHLHFSKKLPVEEAMIKRDISDYYNVIHTIEKGLDKDELSVSVDYQRYYEPSLETSDDIEYDKLIKLADAYYSTFHTWLLNEYVVKK